MSLSQLLGTINSAVGSIEAGKSTVQTAFGTQRDAIQKQAAAKAASDEAQGIIDMQAAQGALQAQNNTRRAATAIGTNMDVNTEIVTQIGAALRQASLRASAQASKISQYKSAEGIVGGTLGGIYDMIYGSEEESKLDAYNNEVNTNSSILQNLNSVTMGVANVQNAIAETHTTATMAALQEKITADSQQELEKLRREAANIDVAEVSQLISMTGQQVSMLATAESARAAAEQRALVNEQRKLLAAERASKAEAEAMSLEYYNIGVETSGATDAVPLKSYSEVKRLVDLGDPRALQFIQIGMRYKATGVPSIAGDAYDARDFAYANPAALNAAQTNVIENIGRFAAEGVSNENIALAMGIPYDTAIEKSQAADLIREARKDKGFMKQLERSSVNSKINPNAVINPSDSTNPYQLPGFENFKDSPFMNENGFLRDYVKPIAMSGDAARGEPIPFDGNQLANLAAKAVEDGTYTMTEVVDGVTNITNAAKLLNNKAINYRWLGMPEMEDVNVQVEWRERTSSLLRPTRAESTVVNLTSPTEVTSAVNRILSAKRKNGIQTDYNFFNPRAWLDNNTPNTPDLD